MAIHLLRPSQPSLPLLFVFFTSLLLQSSPVHPLRCASEKFINKKIYSHCIDLPTLNATLHWTFQPQNSHLSVAFAAPPTTPDGWIAWGINPDDTGMIGCQSFIAFKDSNGSMTVKTYNITSYSAIVEGKISFEVLESKAEFSAGVMKIFATVKSPETMTELNQVWQVGGSVKNGVPEKHEFLPANMKAMSNLQLAGKAQSNGTTAGGSPTVAPSISSSSGNAGIHGIAMFFGLLLGFF